MAASAMIKFLACAAKELRESADRRLYEVASSSTDRLDPSTIYRFEKGRWPENADRVVDLYASDLQIDPVEIWARALELWRADRDAVSPEAEAEAVIGEIEGELDGDGAGDQPDAAPRRSGAKGRASAKRRGGSRRAR